MAPLGVLGFYEQIRELYTRSLRRAGTQGDLAYMGRVAANYGHRNSSAYHHHPGDIRYGLRCRACTYAAV